MIKIALLMIVTSIADTSKVPDVSVTGLYKDIKTCNKVLDDIKLSFEVEDLLDNKKNRFLKMNIRQAHQEGSIYWICKEKVDYK